MANVLALVDDIFFQAKMQETAKSLGVALKVVGSGEQFVTESQSANPTLLIVDLNSRQNPVDAVMRLRAAGSQAPIIAFLSHVQVELAERARAAGCTEVMPRSKFTAQLAQILSGGC